MTATRTNAERDALWAAALDRFDRAHERARELVTRWEELVVANDDDYSDALAHTAAQREIATEEMIAAYYALIKMRREHAAEEAAQAMGGA